MNGQTDNSKSVATLLGGRQITVKKQDGTEETVTVRQLPISAVEDYMKALDSEPALADLYCEKPKGWSLSVTRDDFEQVVIVGGELNDSFFSRYLGRRVARLEMLAPGTRQRIADRLPLPNLSPLPPSGAA